MDRSWYRIENMADTAEVFLYNEIGSFGTSAQEFVADLRKIKTPKIEMHISSPGGEVFDGMAIYNALRNHPAHVTMFIDGIAASAASFIAMAGDRVLAERTATLMIHDGHGIAAGNAKDMLALADLLDKTSDNIASIYAEKAGGEVSAWRERMRAETWYSAAEAQQAGLVDEVVSGKTRVTNSITWDLSMFRYPGRSAAPDPLNHAPAPPDDPEPPADDPPDEAGFFMPALDLAGIRNAVESLDDIPIGAGLITAAISLGVNDCPAPDPPARPEPEPPAPEMSINLPALRRVIREAAL